MSQVRWTTLFLIVMLCIQICHGELEDGISIVVEAGRTECVFRDIDKGTKMDFDLQVLSGGDVDIDVTIKSPSGKIMMEKSREAEISEEIAIIETGPHEFCFDNSFSTFSEKTVYFDLGIDDDYNGQEEITREFNLPKDSYADVENLWKAMDSIGKHFTQMSDMQTVFRSKYKRHEYLQETNFNRVTWFSFGSTSLMLLVGILQVVMIRSLFK